MFVTLALSGLWWGSWLWHNIVGTKEPLRERKEQVQSHIIHCPGENLSTESHIYPFSGWCPSLEVTPLHHHYTAEWSPHAITVGNKPHSNGATHLLSQRTEREALEFKSSLLDSIFFRGSLFLRAESMNNVAAECWLCLPVLTSTGSRVSTGRPDINHRLCPQIYHVLFPTPSPTLCLMLVPVSNQFPGNTFHVATETRVCVCVLCAFPYQQIH